MLQYLAEAHAALHAYLPHQNRFDVLNDGGRQYLCFGLQNMSNALNMQQS